MIENRSPGATRPIGSRVKWPLQASAAPESVRSGVTMGPGIELSIAFWGLKQGEGDRTRSYCETPI